MTPVVFRFLLGTGLGSGALVTVADFQDPVLAKLFIGIAVAALLAAVLWRIYSR
jgi:hypothetical protein